MKDWVEKIDNFLEFNKYHILKDKAEIKKENADKKAIKVYGNTNLFKIVNISQIMINLLKRQKKLKLKILKNSWKLL